MYLILTGNLSVKIPNSDVRDIHFSGFYGLCTYKALGNSVCFLFARHSLVHFISILTPFVTQHTGVFAEPRSPGWTSACV